MKSFEDAGFLSDDAAEWATQHAKDNRAAFELSSDISNYAIKLLYRIEINKSELGKIEPQKAAIAVLFARAISTAQACIILLKQGLPAETKILLRSLLEVIFRLCAIAKDETIAIEYINQDHQHRRDFLKRFKILGPQHWHGMEETELDQMLEDIEQQIQETASKRLTTYWFAEKAGLEEFYRSAYAVFSSAVHVDLRDLEQYFVADANQEIEALEFGPNGKETQLLQLTIQECLLLVVKHVKDVLSLSGDQELDNLEQRFQAYATQIANRNKL